MKYLILSVLLCAGFFLSAQENIDVVTLRSGAIYKGTISEYIPDESVTIKLLDGRVKTFTADEIESVNAITGEKPSKEFTIKEKGYFHASSIGFQLGRSNYYNEVSLAFNTVNGYKYGQSNFGIGTGVETFLNSLFIPVFADYTYSFMKGDFSPYVSGQLGYVFNPTNEYYNDYYYSGRHYEQGLMTGVKFGIKTYINRNFGLIFSAGYRYYHIKGESTGWVHFPEQRSYAVTHRAQLHRFNLGVGILLN